MRRSKPLTGDAVDKSKVTVVFVAVVGILLEGRRPRRAGGGGALEGGEVLSIRDG